MKKILKFINENPTFIVWINCGAIFSITLKSSIWFFVYLGLAFATLNDKKINKKRQKPKKNLSKPQEAEIVKPKPSKK